MNSICKGEYSGQVKKDITAKDMNKNEGVKTHCMLRKQWVVWSGQSMEM